MSTYRVGLAFFYHESHSFSPLRTDLGAFRQEALLSGEEIIEAYRATQTEIGGFLAALDGTEFVPVPLVAAAASPAGQVTTEAYEQIRGDMLTALAGAGELHGLLLALHGAMVVDDYQDPETDLIEHIRRERGSGFPIAVTLDLHANVTQGLIGQQASCFGFQTYPHVDAYEQGVRAATALMRQMRDGITYYQCFAKLPALLPSVNMRTAEGPMHEAVTAALGWETRDGIVAASVFGGYPYADIEGAGASIVVLATDRALGEESCRSLASLLWSLRGEFVTELPGAAAAVALAMQPERLRPVVLADIADNPLSGGSADTTALVSEVLNARVPKSLIGALCDAQVVEQCRAAGEGATIGIRLGGKISPQFGPPLDLEVDIIRVSDGRFRNTGPMNTGLQVDVEGAVHLRAQGTDIVVTGRPITANDPELFGHIGLDVTGYDLLVMKVKNHFRAAFEPLVGDIIYVDAPGVASNDFSSFPFQNLPGGLWPFDLSATFTPKVSVTVIPAALASHRISQ